MVAGDRLGTGRMGFDDMRWNLLARISLHVPRSRCAFMLRIYLEDEPSFGNTTIMLTSPAPLAS